MRCKIWTNNNWNPILQLFIRFNKNYTSECGDINFVFYFRLSLSLILFSLFFLHFQCSGLVTFTVIDRLFSLWFLGQSKNAVVLKIRERSGKEEEEKTKAVPVILLDRGQWSHLDAGCKTTWGLPVVVVGLISTVNSGDSTRGWKRRFHHRQRRIVQPLPLPPPHVAEPLPDKVRCNDSIIIWELIIFSKYRSYFDIFRLLENDFDYWIC